MRRTYRALWLPEFLALLAVVSVTTVVLIKTPIDIGIERYFYGASSSKMTWFLTNRFPWKQLYYYASVPAALTAAASVLVLILGYINFKYKKYRLYAIYLILALVIGPGLLVNLTLKNYWGRPRPVEIKTFGGMWDYQHVLQKGEGGRGKSFPSGHASIGYYFFAFYFIFRRKKRAIAFWSLAAAYGTLLGVTRMSMGGHFLSDVLWSGYIVFFSSWALYYFILRIPQREDSAIGAPDIQLSFRKKVLIVLVYCVIAAGIMMGVLLTTPVYKDIHHTSDEAYVKPYNISVRCSECNVNISFVNNGVLTITGTVQGAGLPGNYIQESFDVGKRFLLAEYKYNLRPHGIYSELTANLNIIVGASTNSVLSLSVDVEDGDITFQTPEMGVIVPQYIFINLKNGQLSLPESLRDKSINLSGTAAVK
ncbi:phosphatase PAP2 family protein [Candidatus Magnetominusculus xianensis]|uniref:Phosphoesterase PA-phosphatase n=1 Tax=Candidatus Magnetominusculus xianensis TaxID=1748249 RepID=A0ABR5SI54_9BACT|nr:phosphatase PAP2 family protein [Candidatus Magnetominusculus xianensis]KWT90496.1 phosphoesterase PA-phosphatase [Candidatus Magnetominusculus xianensis]MBF0404178.1 phosphatase PAP2 family protein [Nitrospirota bacterium]